MRVRQPAALDVRAIFEAAWDAIENRHDPKFWAQCLTEALVPDAWHDVPAANEPYWWHASMLCQCPREAMLKRAKLNTDGFRVESRNVFAIGHLYHSLARYGMHMLGQYEDVQTEVGGRHAAMPLGARADLIYRHAGEPYIVDWKTESEFAGKHRREEASNGTSARHEHQIQVTAGAMVLESTDLLLDAPPLEFEHGWVVYIAKESGEIDQQPVVIDAALRAEVVERVGKLEAAWTDYQLFGTLPPLLPDQEKKNRKGETYMATAWQCRPRSETDGRGLYCSSRTECMKAAARERWDAVKPKELGR